MKRCEYLTPRACALIESSWLRMRKAPRAVVRPAIEAALLEAGFSDEDAQREAERCWAEYWERGNVKPEPA